MALTNKQLHEQAQSLPENVRNRLFSEETTDAVLALADSQNITDLTAIHALARIAAEAVVGAIPKNRLRFSVQERLGVPEGVAVDIADELQRTVLQPFEEMLSQPGNTAPTPTESPDTVPAQEQTEPSTPTPREAAAPEPPSDDGTQPQSPTRKQPSTTENQRGVASERPRIPLPEDQLMHTEQDPTPPPIHAETTPSSQPETPQQPKRAGDPYTEPVTEEDQDDTMHRAASDTNEGIRQPVPERADDTEDGPELDGNVVDLRE